MGEDAIIAQLAQANASLAQQVAELEVPQERPGGPERVFQEPDRAYLRLLRHRLEITHAAVEAATVEARRRVRLNEGQ